MVPWLQYPPLSHLSWVIQKSGPLPLLSQLPIIQPSYLVYFLSQVKIIMTQPIRTMDACEYQKVLKHQKSWIQINYLDWNKREIHPRAFVVPWHHRRASENQGHSFRPNYVVEPPKFPVHNNNQKNKLCPLSWHGGKRLDFHHNIQVMHHWGESIKSLDWMSQILN